MTIEYRERLPSAKEYLALYDTTGWNEIYRISEQELRETLERSWFFLCAYDGDRLVGTGRLLSDGVVFAIVFDMIIAPEYQGRGIGKHILGRLMKKCEQANIRDILLFSAKNKAGFYEKAGFVRRPDDAPGMILRRCT